MLGNLTANLRAARTLIHRLRLRGITLHAIFLYRLPVAAGLRLYAKIATFINGKILNRGVNDRRFHRFQHQRAPAPGPLFHVIVMPRTLHFLLPCLELLPADMRVELLVNGAAAWEQRVLAERFPRMRQLRLATLPGSSQSHGDMLNLMLKNSVGEFGILDHDLYVFDPGLFEQLGFRDRECMLGIYGDVSRQTGLAYPLTHFLYFNTPLLRDLMRRHRVDAGIYPRAPRRLRERLARIGLGPGVYLKDYHRFFDTLHLMLGLAYTEGMDIRLLELRRGDDVYHLGGTSLGSHHTKDLEQLYLHACFLERQEGTEIGRRYSHLTAPLRTVSDIRARLPANQETMHLIETMDLLMARLHARRAMD